MTMPTRVLKPKVLLVLALLAGLVLAPVGDADAKKKRRKKGEYNTRVDVRTIDEHGVLKGLVQSNNGSCVEGRKVRVEHNGSRIGSVAADDAGEWIVETNNNFDSGDRIVAKVDRVKIAKTNKPAKKGNKKSKKNANGSSKKKKTSKKKSYCASDISGPFDLNRLTVGVVGNGTVISTPGAISCRSDGGTCSALFGATTTALDAHPDPGNEFAGYTGDCNTTNPHCELEMDTERNVTARFSGAPSSGGACPLDAIPVLGPILCGLLFPPA
jgi:hypothetical protein